MRQLLLCVLALVALAAADVRPSLAVRKISVERHEEVAVTDMDRMSYDGLFTLEQTHPEELTEDVPMEDVVKIMNDAIGPDWRNFVELDESQPLSYLELIRLSTSVSMLNRQRAAISKRSAPKKEGRDYNAYGNDYNSYGNDYNAGYNAGYDNSYNAGYDNSYNAGYDNSYNAGYDNSYNAGYDNSYNAGYDNTYDNAGYNTYDNSYNAGYDNSYNAGYDNSYNSGYNAGYDNSYNSGYGEESYGYGEESYSYSSYDNKGSRMTNFCVCHATSMRLKYVPGKPNKGVRITGKGPSEFAPFDNKWTAAGTPVNCLLCEGLTNCNACCNGLCTVGNYNDFSNSLTDAANWPLGIYPCPMDEYFLESGEDLNSVDACNAWVDDCQSAVDLCRCDQKRHLLYTLGCSCLQVLEFCNDCFEAWDAIDKYKHCDCEDYALHYAADRFDSDASP